MNGLISLYKIAGCTGNCTNKLRVERILQHLHYSPEAIKEILDKFPKKTQDLDDDDDDGLQFDDAGLDSKCEAQMLAKLVEGLEKNRVSSGEPPSKKAKIAEKKDDKPVNHGEFEQLVERPDLSGERVPPRCSLKVHQGNGNPYVQGMLPAGEKYKGFNSHSKSFIPPSASGSSGAANSSSGSKRTVLTEQAAKTQVLAWLWDWWNHEGSKASKK